MTDHELKPAMSGLLVVRYVHPQPGFSGNIIWTEAFPMKNSVFPAGHPCAAGTGSGYAIWDGPGGPQFGRGKNLDDFRARGYWASCFPEGDGITLQPLNGQTPAKVRGDITECFEWKVANA